MRFSALDSAPVRLGGTAADALAECLTRARRLDELGCHRLWFTEHHLAPDVASGSPLTLVGQAATQTRHMRVGAGGVMIRFPPRPQVRIVIAEESQSPGSAAGPCRARAAVYDRRMATTVPPEILAALTGRPEVGSWEPMFPLLTIDERGFPYVCMLSRAELKADENHIYAALASRTTLSNLSRSPTATLMVILDDSAHYLNLTLVHTSVSVPAAVVFELVSSVRDSLAIPLRPPRYLVTSSLPVAEAWAQSAKLLSSLTGQRGGLITRQEPPEQSGRFRS